MLGRTANWLAATNWLNPPPHAAAVAPKSRVWPPNISGPCGESSPTVAPMEAPRSQTMPPGEIAPVRSANGPANWLTPHDTPGP